MVADFQIIEYFAKSCPHCEHMAPVWDKAVELAESSGSPVDWVQKECYGDNWAPGKDYDFCVNKGVDAFPTIILENHDGSESWTAPALTGATAAQKAEQLVEFVDSHVGTETKMQFVDGSFLLAACAPRARFENFL